MRADAGSMTRPVLVEPPDGYVRVGRLGRSFKLDGGVRLHVEAALTEEELDALLEARPRLFVAGLGETRLRSADTRTGSPVILIEGVRDRTAARAVVNAAVWVRAEDTPDEALAAMTAPAAEDVLTGLPVVVDGNAFGTVTAAHLNDVNPFVEVRSVQGHVSLVSLLAPYIEVTADALVISSPPEGLLE